MCDFPGVILIYSIFSASRRNEVPIYNSLPMILIVCLHNQAIQVGGFDCLGIGFSPFRLWNLRVSLRRQRAVDEVESEVRSEKRREALGERLYFFRGRMSLLV